CDPRPRARPDVNAIGARGRVARDSPDTSPSPRPRRPGNHRKVITRFRQITSSPVTARAIDAELCPAEPSGAQHWL
ncbi:MAG TPA: hypothetical protein VL068_04055, partial [Microthrixaceae bacterium]|nr:hypothetical protein [Microthrixaceae bacterium]